MIMSMNMTKMQNANNNETSELLLFVLGETKLTKAFSMKSVLNKGCILSIISMSHLFFIKNVYSFPA